MQWNRLQNRYDRLDLSVRLETLCTAGVGLMLARTEPGPGDLYNWLLDEVFPGSDQPETQEQAAELVVDIWDFILGLQTETDLPFLTQDASPVSIQQLLEDAQLLVQLLLQSEDKPSWSENPPAAFTDVQSIETGGGVLELEQIHDRVTVLWQWALSRLPGGVPEEDDVDLSPEEMVHLIVREVHFNGDWEAMLDTVSSDEVLGEIFSEELITSLQEQDDTGTALLELLDDESMGLVETAMQLLEYFEETLGQEPESLEEEILQSLMRLLLYRDSRSDAAWNQLLEHNQAIIHFLKEMIGDPLLQLLIGPGFGLNFPRLIMLTRQVGVEHFQRELLALLDSPVPAVLEELGAAMARMPELFLDELLQRFENRPVVVGQHQKLLMVLGEFTEEPKIKAASLQFLQDLDESEFMQTGEELFALLGHYPDRDTIEQLDAKIDQMTSEDQRPFYRQLRELTFGRFSQE